MKNEKNLRNNKHMQKSLQENTSCSLIKSNDKKPDKDEILEWSASIKSDH
jgi:hypothetical protein